MTYPFAIGDRRELYSDLSIATAQSMHREKKLEMLGHAIGKKSYCCAFARGALHRDYLILLPF